MPLHEQPLRVAGPANPREAPILPLSFDEVVEEITRFTGAPRAEVAERVWYQALVPGWNVIRDVARFQVTPHRHDRRMERLYREGDGFIYETLVFWATPERRRWTEQALDRVHRYAAETGIGPEALRVLMLGDGAGNDALYFAMHDLAVDYFDVPGSQTYAFAVKRFAHYGYLGRAIRPIESYEPYLNGAYDVVISFDVLEHLPDPAGAIRDIGKLLRPGGIALITEDFGDIVASLPTHLKMTRKLKGATPFLFLKQGMGLTWYSREPLFKPYEFRKMGQVTFRDWLSLIGNYHVRALYLSRYTDMVTRTVGNLPYLGGRG